MPVLHSDKSVLDAALKKQHPSVFLHIQANSLPENNLCMIFYGKKQTAA